MLPRLTDGKRGNRPKPRLRSVPRHVTDNRTLPRTITPMRPVAERILDAFQLTRLSLAFGAVCELWLVTLLTRADPRYVHLPVYHMPIWRALGFTAVTALGLFSFAASLNDLVDVRHDRRFSPDRPLAAGRIRTSSAALLSFGALMAAVISASALGEPSLFLTVGVAAGIMFYDVVA